MTIPGNQLDILYEPTRDTKFNVSVSYIKARNKNFITPAGQNFNGLAGYAADWTISGGFSQDFHLGAGYIRAAADADMRVSGGQTSFTTSARNKGAMLLNASLSPTIPMMHWNIGIWGKNLDR